MKADDIEEDPLCLRYIGVDLVREIAKEHAAIHEVIRRIEQELDRLLAHPAELGGRWELPDLTKSCREHLMKHFQLEERGGLLGDEVLRCSPEVQRTVTELIKEHRDFERRISRIVEELDTGFVPSDTVQNCFDGELRSLIADLARHESVESELFLKTLRRESDTGV